MVDKMDREKTFIKGEIQHGDIICVQKKLNQEEFVLFFFFLFTW